MDRFSLFFSLIALCIIASSGCEQSFQPLKKNEEYIFSIYGYLDASADTQWVRVSPARGQLAMPPKLPNMRVTLEDLEQGRKVVMNDSLFSPGNGVYYVNVWTTMNIENGQTYRLRAERPDGASSQVTVTLPDSFPVPIMRRETHFIGEPDTYTLFVEGVDKLVAIQTRWYVKLTAPGFEKKKLYSFSYRDKYEKIGERRYRIPIPPEKDKQKIRVQSFLPESGQVEVLHSQVFVATGGPEWNEEIPSLDEMVYTLPGGISNVENGLGYLIGIDSKLIPLESCRENEMLVPCSEEEPYW